MCRESVLGRDRSGGVQQMAHSKITQRDAKELAQGYSKGLRLLDIGSIVSFLLLEAGVVYRIVPHISESPWLVLSAVLLGFIGADFVSGFVHWLADTWGSVDMPVIGKALIRPFREHHVDPEAITRHDFIETNGNNCLISLWVAVIALLLPLGPDHLFALFMSTWMGALILWVMFTNQFHKYAHMRHAPRWVIWLQKLHLILPPSHHDVHHTAPFNKYYCITVGWVNWPLTFFRFFPTLERIVTALTGILPRKDDIGEKAALAVAEEMDAEARERALAERPVRESV